VFIAQYAKQPGPNNQYKLASLAPYTPKDPDIPAAVAQISPTFVEIFKQAETAKAFTLDQLEGYRAT
jgi:hypothetical protein